MYRKTHPVIKKLLTDIEAYLALSGDTPTAFGRKAMGDGNFITRLRLGRLSRVDTIGRAYDYIEKNTKAARPKK
jgi:hypothetical protein